MTYRYRLAFEPDDNGTILVTSPDFPPLATFGKDEADARRQAMEALTTLITSMIDAGDCVPTPYDGEREPAIALPLLASLKVELHRAMISSGVGRAELQQRLGWRKPAVDRLFRLSYSSRITDLEAAFRVLGRGIEFEARPEVVAVSTDLSSIV